MKKIVLLTLLLITLVFTLCACQLFGGDTDGSTGDGTQSGDDQTGNGTNNVTSGAYD